MKEHGEEIEQARGASEAKEEKPNKRGETAQQQIRKAKKVTRRRFSAEDKVGMVMEECAGKSRCRCCAGGWACRRRCIIGG